MNAEDYLSLLTSNFVLLEYKHYYSSWVFSLQLQVLKLFLYLVSFHQKLGRYWEELGLQQERNKLLRRAGEVFHIQLRGLLFALRRPHLTD